MSVLPPVCNPKPGRPARADSYRAAAAYAGVSPGHVFQLLNGDRQPSPQTRRALRAWAKSLSPKLRRSPVPTKATAL